MNYDTTSVDDLVLELIDELLPEEVSAIGTKTPRYEGLESALRKAVIREASVGVMTLGMLQHRRRMAAPIKDLPDGAYDLIPKETP